MDKYTGFLTTDGKPVITGEFIQDLRDREKDKLLSSNFIAQLGPQEDDLHSSVDILITGGNRGGGKANPYDTPVITPAGKRLMGDLQVGDLICTPYEGVQKVTNIFEKGENTIYTFHFDDGTTVQCMDEHRFWAKAVPSGDFKEMTAREIMDLYRIDEKYPNSLRRGVYDYVEIPLCGEVQMNEERTQIDLPIHPFIFGIICGNGFWHFSKSGVPVQDHRYILWRAQLCGYRPKKIMGTYRLRGISDENRRRITNCRNEQPARIPNEYLTASVESRIELIRGIMFKNGKSKHKHPYLSVPNKAFVEDVAQLVRSLGMWARVTEVTDDPERVGHWQVVMIAPDDKVVWANCYKMRAQVNAEPAKSPNSRNILTKRLMYVTKNKKKKNCRCITVSGRHHLYMTDAFTINHNTFTLLMEPMYDIGNQHFNGVIFRKEKDDLTNIIRDSRLLYSPFGRYNKSKDDQTWYFTTGAELSLSYYADSYDDFKDRFQGRQYPYIGIDEITQMEFEKFKYLITCNRNASHIKNRVVGTCNPDPLSWVRKFINWWIGEDGYPVPERNGVIRYCYMKGESVDTIVWGDTPEEVYEQCKDEIDRLWEPEYGEMGFNKLTMFTKSVTFIRAELKYNKKLLLTDPNYVGGLAQQGEEQQARDLQGNWNFMSLGDDMVKMFHLQQCFQNPQMTGDGVHRASCDVAFQGGDNCVLWHRIGHHIDDVFVCRLNSVDTCNAVQAKLTEWGVLESNLIYDLNGLGQTFKGFFKKARPFNNIEAVDQRYKNIYGNKKDQSMYCFAQRVINGELSFNPAILDRKIRVGKSDQWMYIRDVLMLERKCVRQDESKADKGYCNINKATMKSLIGWSPDLWESLMMSEDFFLNRRKVTVPMWVYNF